MNGIIRFLKDWTLPVSIAVGTVSYLTFNYVPALDEAGDWLGSVFDVLFPISVFMTLFVTFCKVDFHEMRPHCWHAGILVAQLLLITVTVALAWSSDNSQLLTLNSKLSTLNSQLSTLNSKLFYEALLTCIIGPSASAAPVVVGKLGGNISTMTTYTLISSLASALLIPLVFPMLEPAAGITFMAAFLIILEKVSYVLLLPLVLGWMMQHYLKRLCAWIVSMPDLSFYCWAFSLSITTGITVKNIVHSTAPITDSSSYLRALLDSVRHRQGHRQTAGRGSEQRSGPVPEEHGFEHLGGVYVSESRLVHRCRLLCAVAEHH